MNLEILKKSILSQSALDCYKGYYTWFYLMLKKYLVLRTNLRFYLTGLIIITDEDKLHSSDLVVQPDHKWSLQTHVNPRSELSDSELPTCGQIIQDSANTRLDVLFPYVCGSMYREFVEHSTKLTFQLDGQKLPQRLSLSQPT